MHPFEDVQGQAGFAALITRVCASPLARCSRSLYAPQSSTQYLIFECASFCCRSAGGYVMYAVIRTGGKQYRVTPGDVVKIESVTAGLPPEAEEAVQEAARAPAELYRGAHQGH